MTAAPVLGSASLDQPTMWWYEARSRLLKEFFSDHVADGALLLDVGSADGPSVEWLRGRARCVPVDLDPRGLGAGGVQADALRLPFADGTFDVVTAFDVVEHFADDHAVLDELVRVTRPGGRLLISVPAYQWAWSHFDQLSGHHRRYTASRLRALARTHGCAVERLSYLFAATLPMFAASRWLLPRFGADIPTDGRLPAWLDRALLGLTTLDRIVLRRGDLPFGSSVAASLTVPRPAGSV